MEDWSAFGGQSRVCCIHSDMKKCIRSRVPSRNKWGSNISFFERYRSTFRTATLLLSLSSIEAFHVPSYTFLGRSRPKRTSKLWVYAPPGSGYSRSEDEESALPNTYEPMMEYPGTMRPGRTPENMPFQDLPIGDNDPDPVPWPHFQQIEWHHRWEPPHPHPIPMEEFIEMHGRWATPEMEAAMRAGVRRDVREQREEQEAAKRETIITDDADDDFQDDEEPVSLGDGIFGKLGSDADRAQTAVATSPDRKSETEEDTDEGFDDGLGDFLLDLGLDAELDEDLTEEDEKDSPPAEDDKTSITLSDGGDVTATISVDDDDDLELGLDDDDDIEDGADTVPLDDDFGNDTLDTEDIFDEGGFDFDDGDFGDGGDMW